MSIYSERPFKKRYAFLGLRSGFTNNMIQATQRRVNFPYKETIELLKTPSVIPFHEACVTLVPDKLITPFLFHVNVKNLLRFVSFSFLTIERKHRLLTSQISLIIFITGRKWIEAIYILYHYYTMFVCWQKLKLKVVPSLVQLSPNEMNHIKREEISTGSWNRTLTSWCFI